MSEVKFTFNEHNKKDFKALYNRIKKSDLYNEEISNDNYIDKIDYKKLISFIKNLDLSLSRRESFMYMVLKYYRVNKPNSESAIAILKTEADKMKNERRTTEGENELDEKETQYFRNKDFFINIIENSNPTTDRQKMAYLLLNLLVYQPPLRTSYYTTAEIHKSGGYDENKNYLFFKNTPNKKRCLYFVGKDKVSNAKNFSSIESKTIEIEDTKLIELLNKSIEEKPRTYLLELNGKKISDKTLNKLLQEITKLKGITLNMLRASYITYFYNSNPTMNDKKELAKKMRHSVQAGETFYFKLNTAGGNNNKSQEENINIINNLKDENNKLKNEIDELKEQLKQMEKYKKLINLSNKEIQEKKQEKEEEKDKGETDDKVKDKKYKHRRKNYIQKINKETKNEKDHIKNPSKKLLDFYDIKFDNKTKKYY